MTLETRYDVHSADDTAHDVYHTTSSLTLSSGTADRGQLYLGMVPIN